MSVYLRGGLVLFESGSVATDAECCCEDCTDCAGLSIPTCTTPEGVYLVYTATFDYSESIEGECEFFVNYTETKIQDPDTCAITRMCSGSANGTPICANCVSGTGCVGLDSLPTPDCSGTYIGCEDCGVFDDPCSEDGTSYSLSCACIIDSVIDFSRSDEIALSEFTPPCPCAVCGIGAFGGTPDPCSLHGCLRINCDGTYSDPAPGGFLYMTATCTECVGGTEHVSIVDPDTCTIGECSCGAFCNSCICPECYNPPYCGTFSVQLSDPVPICPE